MQAQQINLIGPAYDDETKPYSAQDTVNWIPQVAEVEGQRSVIALKGAPGATARVTGLDGAVRGMWTMAKSGELYVVAGSKFYFVSDAWVATEIGLVTGSGRVGMADNGDQLVMVSGAAGWVYDKADSSFGLITDPDFTGAYTVAFLDQYGIFDGQNGQFRISALADFQSFAALDFVTAESSPDPTLAVLVDHRELWIFGSSTVEIWQNTGNPDFPFERNSGVMIERGLGARYSTAKMDNSVYWVGEDGIVYAAQGYTPQRISTHPIEQDLKSSGFTDAFAFTYRDKGHWFYVLTVPGGKTWVFDAATKMWHRRKTYGLDRWRANAYAYAYGKHLIGDYESGTVFELLDDVYVDGDSPLVSERVTQAIHSEQNPIFGNTLELLFDTGHGSTDGSTPTSPVVEIAWSDDFGRNFGNYRQRSIGAAGQYRKRVLLHGLGRFENRLFHVRVSDAVKRDWIATSGRGSAGAYT